MLPVDVVRLVLQQPARLVHHPVGRVDGHHHAARLVDHVHGDVQLRLRALHHLVHLLAHGLEHDESDLILVRLETEWPYETQWHKQQCNKRCFPVTPSKHNGTSYVRVSKPNLQN